MQLQDLDTSHRFAATVVTTERISPDNASAEVRELVLDLNAPGLSLDVGQSLGVLAPAPDEFGQRHHLRLYSVADLPEKNAQGKPRIRIAVRRCTYVDEYSGESYDGVASNYLCDLREGEHGIIEGGTNDRVIIRCFVPKNADPLAFHCINLHPVVDAQGRIVAPAQHEPPARPAGVWDGNADARRPLNRNHDTGE